MCFSSKPYFGSPPGCFYLASCCKTGVGRHSVGSLPPTSSPPAPHPPHKPITPVCIVH